MHFFATITNANFDDQAILNKVDNGVRIKRELLALAKENNVTLPNYQEVNWGGEKADYEAEGDREGVLRTENEDLRSFEGVDSTRFEGYGSLL